MQTLGPRFLRHLFARSGPSMGKFFRGFGRVLWTAGLAVALTALTSGVWSALLMANLATTPAIPWAAAAMAIVSWASFSFLGGQWGPRRTQAARRNYLRANLPAAGTFVAAVTAGVLCLVALAGLWIVLHQLVTVPGNRLPDFSRYPLATVIATLVMAAVSGAVSEEAGFRGYFQGTLERYLPGPLAILICALVMAPEHALTQGFVWPILLFYLLVDAMLGVCAWLTKSIVPGIVVHTLGLFVFFVFVWPYDTERAVIWQGGADRWFWIHLVQTIVFAVLGILVFRRVANGVARVALAPHKQGVVS
jgi:membrane protease YdiL (CAAX protease family)